jgi:hypothetical protein
MNMMKTSNNTMNINNRHQHMNTYNQPHDELQQHNEHRRMSTNNVLQLFINGQIEH